MYVIDRSDAVLVSDARHASRMLPDFEGRDEYAKLFWELADRIEELHEMTIMQEQR